MSAVLRAPSPVPPTLPNEAWTSFQIVTPISTHFRPATCEEIGCKHFLEGWQVRVEGLEPQMLHTATHSGRRFRRVQVAEGETWLLFEAGQPCFKTSTHRMRLERPEFFYRRPGDWRGLPPGERPFLHQRPEHWVEDFAEHQDRLITALNRG